MRLLKSFVLAAALMLAISSTAQAQKVQGQLCASPVAKVDSFAFLVDYSGSMMMHYRDGQIVGKEKMELAKDIMYAINSKLANLNYQAGIFTFAPFGTVLPEGPYDKTSFAAAVGKLRSDYDTFYRMTPMGDGINSMSSVVQSMPGKSAVILISDGISNRGTDPVEQARSLYASHPSTTLHVVSLADTKEGKAILDQIAHLNPNTVYVNGYDLLNNEQSLNQFIYDVFYTCGNDEVIVLRSVQFALNSAVLDSTAKGILREAAVLLKDRRGTVFVDGHTCNLGTAQYNMRLSERRAHSVRTYLVEQGVPADRMVARGFGLTRPKYSNATEETRKLNRRVELSVE